MSSRASSAFALYSVSVYFVSCDCFLSLFTSDDMWVFAVCSVKFAPLYLQCTWRTSYSTCFSTSRSSVLRGRRSGCFRSAK